MAESTEIAGVMAPSPYSNAAPIRPTIRSCARQVPGWALRAESSANNATMPPSPLLSARRISHAYFSEMIRISAHRISDTTPRIASGASGPPWAAALAASFSA